MRRLVLAVVASLAVIGLAAVAVADEAADKKDKEQLQGTWTAVSGEQEGKEDAKAKEHAIVFEGDKFSVKRGDKVEVQGTFKIDASKSPKTMDMNITEGPEDIKGKTAQAIYVLSGDELTWCVSEPGSGKRPEKLATKEGVKDMLVKFKREKK
jgi:uncharacterized protein (TIGR03067 family)